jgi:hypothetical protein
MYQADRSTYVRYRLLSAESGRDYERLIVEQAIQKRQEQVANADDSRVKEALPAPDQETLNHYSYGHN